MEALAENYFDFTTIKSRILWLAISQNYCITFSQQSIGLLLEKPISKGYTDVAYYFTPI